MAKKRPPAAIPQAPKRTTRRVLKAAPKEPFPWWPLLLLIATVGLFWVLPRRQGVAPVRVDFKQVDR